MTTAAEQLPPVFVPVQTRNAVTVRRRDDMTLGDADALPSALELPKLSTPSTPRAAWRASYRRLVLLADVLAVLFAGVVAALVRFGLSDAGIDRGGYHVSYVVISAGLAPVWVAALWMCRAYEGRFLGAGTD